MVAAMLFYEAGNKKCEEAMDILEELDVHVVPTDVYNDEYLSLVDSWTVCCTPTVVFFPSYNCYLPEHVSKEAFQEEVKYCKSLEI